MLYYVVYSCGCGENEEIISAKTKEDAWNYDYQKAIDDYESYEGLHGVRGISDIIAEDFVEDEMTEEDYEEAEDIYFEERENTISYGVEDYDFLNYGWLLEEQETAYEI